MSKKHSTAPPKWAAPIWQDTLMLSKIGKAVDLGKLTQVLGSGFTNTSDHQIGLAALAVALCRSQDGLHALALNLLKEDQSKLLNMAGFAQVVVQPGEPTKMRATIKQLLQKEQ